MGDPNRVDPGTLDSLTASPPLDEISLRRYTLIVSGEGKTV